MCILLCRLFSDAEEALSESACIKRMMKRETVK